MASGMLFPDSRKSFEINKHPKSTIKPAMSTSSSRPLLLPQNRRLRHLQALCIRNLTLPEPRSQTLDDTSIPSRPSLPAHPSSQNRKDGNSILHHAHSSSELRPSPKLRRRSTNWATKDMGSRQKRLEDVMAVGLVDTWFAICVRDSNGEIDPEPVYISEVLERVMNPGFKEFDLRGEGRGISAASEMVVKVFVRKRKEDGWACLLEEVISLRKMRWIGGKLENCVFRKNAVVVKLVDGFYAMDVDIEGGAKVQKVKEGGQLMDTSSYSALMRLSNLDESIQDALATREELARQINEILEKTPEDLSEQANEGVKLANRYVTSERKMLKASTRRRAELKASIQARSNAIMLGNEVQTKVMDDINNAQEQLSQCRTLLTTTTSEIHGQRRRICEELLTIFPIESTTHPLLFTICGLPLPNSTFEDADEEIISAALGYVTRLVDMLQYYLAVPLPYPVSPYGSRSIIQDTISILQDSQRTFPLYMKSTVRFRFDYGVFLLNKNIECLAESQGLKVMDIRQTLPNLKYLLYVCSAGSSELPVRKAGGIRGLLTGRGMEITSRRGSADSGTVAHDVARRALETGVEGKGRLFGGGDAQGQESLLAVPFGGGQHKSLRTSGLRENVR